MSHSLRIYIDIPDEIDPATTDPMELAETLVDELAVEGAALAIAEWEGLPW